MSDTTARQPTARFARRPDRGVLLGLSWPRLIALAPCPLFLLAGFQFGPPGLVVAVIGSIPFVAAAFVRFGGQTAAEWFPVGSVYLLRKATGQTEYLARVDRPRPLGTLALPGDAASVRFYDDPGSGICMLHDPYRQTISAVLQVQHPAYTLLGADSQTSRVSAYGRLLAGLAPSGTCASLQIVEATIPDSGRGVHEWYAEHGVHDGGWADRQYRELVASTTAAATVHRSTLTLSVNLKAAAREVKAAGGGMAGAARVLRGEIESLEFSLRAAELNFGRWMTEAEIAHLIRRAFDPALGGEFQPDSPGANLAHAGPLAVSERWASMRHDSGYSTVLWVSEFPRLEVPATFLHALVFSPGVRKTLSVSIRPLETGSALRQIRREKADWLADQSTKAKTGRIQDLSEVQEYQDIQTREQSLIAGHADVQFTGLLVVTAETDEELRGALRQIERAASQSGCETRPLYGRQQQGFNAALPIGRSTF